MKLLPKCLLVVLLFVLLVTACSRPKEQTAPASKAGDKPEQLTYCYGGLGQALHVVAESKRMFADEGLEVTVRRFALGNNALDELLAGRCDVAVLAETPVVVKSFERNDFSLLASIRSNDNMGRVVGRRDRGIGTIADLKGRRVGIPKGTAPHYFLDMELARHGLSDKDITPVYLESDKLLPGIVDGTVDAVAMINAMAYRAGEQLGAKAVVMADPGRCFDYTLLVARKEYVAAHSANIRGLLRAFSKAERFCAQSPEKKRSVIIASQKISAAEYAAVWKSYEDRLALDNALLLTLEEHARWAQAKNIVKKQPVPNYLLLIDAEHLRNVAPEAVRLKR